VIERFDGLAWSVIDSEFRVQTAQIIVCLDGSVIYCCLSSHDIKMYVFTGKVSTSRGNVFR